LSNFKEIKENKMKYAEIQRISVNFKKIFFNSLDFLEIG